MDGPAPPLTIASRGYALTAPGRRSARRFWAGENTKAIVRPERVNIPIVPPPETRRSNLGAVVIAGTTGGRILSRRSTCFIGIAPRTGSSGWATWIATPHQIPRSRSTATSKIRRCTGLAGAARRPLLR